MPRESFEFDRLSVCTRYFLTALAKLREQQAKMDRVLVTVDGLLDFMVSEWGMTDRGPEMLEPRQYSDDVVNEYIVYALYRGSDQKPNYIVYAFVQVVDKLYTVLLAHFADYPVAWEQWKVEWREKYGEDQEDGDIPGVWPYWVDGKVLLDPTYTKADLEEEFRMWQVATFDIRRVYENDLSALVEME